MIKWLKSFKQNNGIDLMPAFNGYVREAAEELNKRPDMLASMAAVQGIAAAAKTFIKKYHAIRMIKRNHPDRLDDNTNRVFDILQSVVENEPGITSASAMLGLKIPPAETVAGSDIAALMAHYDDVLRLAKSDAFVKSIQWERIIADVKRSRPFLKWPNRYICDEAVVAVKRIAAKIVQPLPADSQDVREEAQKIHRHCEAFNWSRGESLCKNNTYAVREGKKVAQRLRQFLDMLEACDYDLDKLRGWYLHHESPPGRAPADFSTRITAERSSQNHSAGI